MRWKRCPLFEYPRSPFLGLVPLLPLVCFLSWFVRGFLPFLPMCRLILNQLETVKCGCTFNLEADKTCHQHGHVRECHGWLNIQIVTISSVDITGWSRVWGWGLTLWSTVCIHMRMSYKDKGHVVLILLHMACLSFSEWCMLGHVPVIETKSYQDVSLKTFYRCHHNFVHGLNMLM